MNKKELVIYMSNYIDIFNYIYFKSGFADNVYRKIKEYIFLWEKWMAVTKAERVAYNNYVKEHHDEIDQSKDKLKGIGNKIKSMPAIKEYLNLEAVLEHLKIINLFVKMNDISLDMLDQKNESFLNNARKEIYKILQKLEEIVGNEIDRSLKENEEYLEKIDNISPAQIISLFQKIHEIIKILINRMGEGSKWKWSFVDIQGRIAVSVKNFVNFSHLQKYRDPRTEYYRERYNFLKMCKSGLSEAAQQYRTRYEVSTKVPADMLKSIDLLSSLKKINILFGESDEASKLKNTIDALRERMEADEKKTDKKKKKKKKK